MARRIADLLKDWIIKGRFPLTAPVEPLPLKGNRLVMHHRTPTVRPHSREPHPIPDGQFVFRDEFRCVHCGVCITYCPSGVFQRDDDWRITDNPFLCVACGACRDVCPHGAISLRE